MIGQWLNWINYTLIGLAFILAGAGTVYWIKGSGEIRASQEILKESKLPKGAFELAEGDYQNLAEPILSLEQAPLDVQLPDLRQQLVFYGKNGRPDAQEKHTLLHFSFNGNKTVSSVGPDEKLYLVYDRKGSPPRYAFSPNNEKSSLWIEAKPIENDVEVHVVLENDKGERITEPENYAEFRLSEKEFSRYAGTNWEIGTCRVDGTLLARQKAKWFGVDRFLENHGGDDFQHNVGKHRIDLGENEELYSVFVGPNDCLVWKDEKWNAVEPGEKSLGHPLLVVKKIDDRLMTFELWDVEGKGKILLNLLKSTEPWGVQNAQVLQATFKFVGARTRTQCVFEVNRERMILRPSDWLLLTAKGWKKLESAEEIDDYVKRKATGALFVFEGLKRENERQVMKGTLYSPARHDSTPIEIALQTTGTKVNGKDQKDNKDAKGAETDVPAPRSREADPRFPAGRPPQIDMRQNSGAIPQLQNNK